MLLACSLGPGLFLVRRFDWPPLEKFCALVGLSLLVTYLAVFVIYVLGLPPVVCFLVPVGSMILTVGCGKDLKRLSGDRELRGALAGYALLAVWTLAWLGLARHYGGAGWITEWAAQYDRTLFFLERRPLDTGVLDRIPLGARPPLMNLLATGCFACAGASYAAFQVFCSQTWDRGRLPRSWRSVSRPSRSRRPRPPPRRTAARCRWRR